LKIILIYPQQKTIIAQKRMQEVQPKIKQIQEEFK
jgi:membrane protein insertase Oxa1/YidC/SpoIIIJ